MSTKSRPQIQPGAQDQIRLRTTDGLPEALGESVDLRSVERGRRTTTVYYDTDRFQLSGWGVTLRRVTGMGGRSGWYLGLPGDGGTRDEVRRPLSAGRPGQVPRELAGLVMALTRGAALAPVASRRGRRTNAQLTDGDGEVVARMVDEAVQRMDQPDTAQHDVELVPAQREGLGVVTAVADRMVEQGARPASEPVASDVLGAGGGTVPEVEVGQKPGPRDAAGEALRAHIAKYVTRFLLADVRVRRDLPEAVHDMRVAARHLRSDLKTFGSLVDKAWADGLRDELRWAASHLGDLRDSEVMARQMTGLARDLPEPHAEAATAAIEREMRRRMGTSRQIALEEMASGRYLSFLEALVDGANDPPFTAAAQQPAGDVLRKRLKRSWKRLAKDVRTLRADSPAEDWHEARKRAKRTRYAADLASGVLGGGAKAFAAEMSKVTDVLGDLHDAHVAEDALEWLVTHHRRMDASTSYALGLLGCREREEQARLREGFGPVWRDAAKAYKKL